MAVSLSESPSYPGHYPCANHFFAVLPLNDRKRAACSFFKIGHLFSLFSCLSLALSGFLILLLLLMSSSVHPIAGSVFPCSVCAGNVTWRGRSVQCYTYSKWVHLKCSLLSSKFRTFGSSHSWSCSCFCVSAYSGDNAVTSSSDFSSLYTSTV